MMNNNTPVYKLLKNNFLNIFLILPPFLMALMPWSMENKFNFIIFGYDSFFLIPVAFLVSFFRADNKKKMDSIEKLYIFITCFFSVLSLFLLEGIKDGQYFSHLCIGLEFLFGFYLAKRIVYNDRLIRIVYYGSVIVLFFVLLQQLSFSIGLGMFESGQNFNTNVEITDGVMRVGTTVGGSTFTGIFVVLLAGLIVGNSPNRLFDILFYFLAFLSVIVTGTRSGIFVMLMLGIFMLFSGSYKMPKFLKIIALICAVVYLLPFLSDVLSSRNAESRADSDITSGRVEKWQTTLNYMEKEPASFFVGFGGGTVPVSFYNEKNVMLQSPHNSYIGTLFQFGLIGLIVFLVLLYYKARRIMAKSMSTGFVVIVGSLLLSFNSEVVALNFLYSFFFWLIVNIEFYKNEKNCLCKRA